VDRLNLLAPLELSHTATELEQAMQKAFIKTYVEMLGSDISAVFDYCAPHMAGIEVIERFTKKDGLVVLRRPEVSETLMRVIYANWVSTGSKRGLAFLDFVLRMLWPGQYEIKRLFHSKEMARDYPARLTYEESSASFLTTRIHVVMNNDVDMQEVTELAPTLTKLVPANVVPSIAVSVEMADINLMSSIGIYPLLISDFSPQLK
jgi:hypothetical protein